METKNIKTPYAVVAVDQNIRVFLGPCSMGKTRVCFIVDDAPPVNPATGEPYFKMREDPGWGTGWGTGEKTKTVNTPT